MFPPFDSWIPLEMKSFAYVAWAGMAKFVAIGTIALTVLGSRLRGRVAALAVAMTVTLFISPTLIVLRDWYETTHFLEPVARYGLGTIPAVAVVMANATERHKTARLVVAAVAVALYASAFLAVLF